jgi:hypothetical protein
MASRRREKKLKLARNLGLGAAGCGWLAWRGWRRGSAAAWSPGEKAHQSNVDCHRLGIGVAYSASKAGVAAAWPRPGYFSLGLAETGGSYSFHRKRESRRGESLRRRKRPEMKSRGWRRRND